MRALASIEYYNGRRIGRDETFSALSEADAKILELLDKARRIGHPVAPEAESEAVPVRQKRRYRRRDLTAEP